MAALHILHVDDDHTHRGWLRAAFRRQGRSVDWRSAADADSAVDFLVDQVRTGIVALDLVIADLGDPRLVTFAKTDTLLRRIPFLVLGPVARLRTLMESGDLLADAYHVKPTQAYGYDDLATTLAGYLRVGRTPVAR